MSTIMKTLLIRPADVSLVPLGAESNVADAQVEVAVDRDVALDDGTYIAGRVPFVATSIPTGGLRVPVVANDDAAITRGDGFSIVVTVTYRPRLGSHRHPQRFERRILITSADPDVVNLADAKPVRLVPFYMRPSEYVTHLETTLTQAQTDLESARSTVDAQAKTITDLRARNTAQAATVSDLQGQVVLLTRQVRSLQDQVAWWQTHSGSTTPPVITPSTPDVTVTDLGGGVLDLSGPGVTTGADGTLTLTGSNVTTDGALVTII